MGVKTQFNPSTGKVLYNPATGLVQLFDGFGPGVDCGVCSLFVTPKFVRVTFQGVSIPALTCLDCAGWDSIWSDNFDVNQSFILEQTGDPCRWSLSLDVDIHIVGYSSLDGFCSGNVAIERTYTRLFLTVNRNGLSFHSSASLEFPTDTTLRLFIANIAGDTFLLDEDKCINGTATNQYESSGANVIGCGVGTSATYGGLDGSATFEELS